MVIGAWVFPAIIFSTFVITGYMDYEEYELQLCGPITYGSVWRKVYFYCSLSGPFSLSYVCIVFCNVKVYAKMKEHSMQKSTKLMSKAQSEGTNNVLKLTIICCICPIIFQIPGMLVKPWINETFLLGPFVGIMFHINSVFNPYLTIFTMKPYLRAFHELLGFNTKSSQVHSISTSTTLSSQKGGTKNKHVS